MDIRFISEDVFTVEADGLLYFAENSLAGEKTAILIEKAGERVRETIGKLNGCATGDVKIIPAYDLNQNYVFVSVLPDEVETNIQIELFNNLFMKLFELMDEYRLTSVILDVSFMQKKYGAEYVSLLHKIINDEEFDFDDKILYMSKES